MAGLGDWRLGGEAASFAGDKLSVVKRTITTNDPPTAHNAVKRYNNFAEIGQDNGD